MWPQRDNLSNCICNRMESKIKAKYTNSGIFSVQCLTYGEDWIDIVDPGPSLSYKICETFLLSN